MEWPSLYIAGGMISWYIILIGFVIEAAFVKFFLKEKYLKSALIAFVMSLISTLIGFFAIPLIGIAIEVVMIPFGMVTFHPIHWIVNYVVIILFNALIDGLVIKLFFKHKFKKTFLWLCLANALVVAVCILFHGLEMQSIVQRMDV